MKTGAKFQFRIYVTGDGPNSNKAIFNLKALCREHLADRHEIEIVDLVECPDRALEDMVLMTPMVIKLCPRPVRKIVGTLSDAATVLDSFDIGGSGP
jgi:circadian clock protein KaiB